MVTSPFQYTNTQQNAAVMFLLVGNGCSKRRLKEKVEVHVLSMERFGQQDIRWTNPVLADERQSYPSRHERVRFEEQ